MKSFSWLLKNLHDCITKYENILLLPLSSPTAIQQSMNSYSESI